ncbi:MAG: Hsp33 family molecular chaperone HslO [Rhodospirillaceae bacterium]|nr:Hsp33 family molecular chaperone HslO [Rhodospirillaceae bacterium]
MGEVLALTALLAKALRYQGTFSLQAEGDDPDSLLLYNATSDDNLRT